MTWMIHIEKKQTTVSSSSLIWLASVVFIRTAQEDFIVCITFTIMHLADAFIQSNLFRLYIFVLSVCVFPENWTHNLLHC